MSEFILVLSSIILVFALYIIFIKGNNNNNPPSNPYANVKIPFKQFKDGFHNNNFHHPKKKCNCEMSLIDERLNDSNIMNNTIIKNNFSHQMENKRCKRCHRQQCLCSNGFIRKEGEFIMDNFGKHRSYMYYGM